MTDISYHTTQGHMCSFFSHQRSCSWREILVFLRNTSKGRCISVSKSFSRSTGLPGSGQERQAESMRVPDPTLKSQNWWFGCLALLPDALKVFVGVYQSTGDIPTSKQWRCPDHFFGQWRQVREVFLLSYGTPRYPSAMTHGTCSHINQHWAERLIF